MNKLNQGILKLGLLGTKAKQLETSIFPVDVQTHLDSNKQAEIIYLDGLSLTNAYLTGGQELTKLTGIADDIPICPDEVLPYADARIQEVLRLVLKEGKFSLLTFLPLVLELMNQKKVILPPALLTSLQTLFEKKRSLLSVLRPAFTQACGERGEWLLSLSRKHSSDTLVQADFLDLSKVQRKQFFEKTFFEGDLVQAIAFLEEIFLAETTARQKAYLRSVGPFLVEKHQPILVFFEQSILPLGSKNKGHLALKNYLKILQITFPKGVIYKEYLAHTFTPVWQKRKGLVLKPSAELKTIFETLEGLPIGEYLQTIHFANFGLTNAPLITYLSSADCQSSINQSLFFVLATVPVSVWCRQLDVDNQQFIQEIEKIKLIDDDLMDDYSFLEALVVNAFRNQDLALALAIYQLHGLRFLSPDFLSMMPVDEAFKFLNKQVEDFEQLSFGLVELVVDKLGIKQKWSSAFTKVALENTLRVYEDNRYNLKRALWTGAPYYHDSAITILPDLIVGSYRNRSLQEDLADMFEIRSAINNIKK